MIVTQQAAVHLGNDNLENQGSAAMNTKTIVQCDKKVGQRIRKFKVYP